MTGQKIEQQEADYKLGVEIKKANYPLYNGLTLLNQTLLIWAGRIHNLCLHTGEDGKKEYKKFVETSFAGAYYRQWRENRAVSVAHCHIIYDLLNVDMPIGAYQRETFYAGIPPITAKELQDALDGLSKMEYGGYGVCKYTGVKIVLEKIGIDGKYHPTDKDGEFPVLTDENDIYGDDTGVTLGELQKEVAEAVCPVCGKYYYVKDRFLSETCSNDCDIIHEARKELNSRM